MEKEAKKSNQRKYNKVFIEKNQTKIKEKIICDICCGSYTYFNRSKHFKSRKHLLIFEKYNKNNTSGSLLEPV